MMGKERFFALDVVRDRTEKATATGPSLTGRRALSAPHGTIGVPAAGARV
jgi:hypothetical protein